MKVINQEVDNAIDRSFNILRTRIDRFGTSQPTIQRLQNTGRIQIELPGVDNPERVRKLLQGVAKLEFLEVYQPNEISNSLEAVNRMLVSEKKDTPQLDTDQSKEGKNNTSSNDLSSLTEGQNKDSAQDTSSLEGQLSQKADSTALDSLSNAQLSPLFSLLKAPLNYGLVYSVKDTAAINKIISRADIKALPSF